MQALGIAACQISNSIITRRLKNSPPSNNILVCAAVVVIIAMTAIFKITNTVKPNNINNTNNSNASKIWWTK